MKRSSFVAIGMAGYVVCADARAVQAQQPAVASIEIVTGHAGYVDEVWDNRIVLGGLARLVLTPRLALGPEVLYQRGRDDAHELLVTGTATYDLRAAAVDRRVTPFIVVGAGVARRSSLVGRGPGVPGLQTYVSTEFTASGGLGVRVAATSRVYVAGDVRLGWEPERRVTLSLGWRL